MYKLYFLIRFCYYDKSSNHYDAKAYTAKTIVNTMVFEDLHILMQV